jgi:hypothetical protein
MHEGAMNTSDPSLRASPQQRRLAPVVTVILLLAFPGQSWAAGLACFVLGLSIGTEVDACAYLAARHFGMRSFGALFGTINGLLLFGTGFAPLASNHVYDVVKSYDPVLWSLIPLCLLTAALFLALGRYPDFVTPGADSRPGSKQPRFTQA